MQAAVSIFNRMSEVEKIRVRSSSQDAISHLAHNAYTVDMANLTIPESERESVLTEVQAICRLHFSVKSKESGFGRTWL